MIKINNYHTIETLGKGSMATVYLAQHELLNEKVALKILVFGATDPVSRDRFIQEGQSIAALKHPHIASIYDIGIEDDQFYIAMEYVEKGTLKQKFAQEKLTINRILTIIDQITAALSYIHKKGYVHRDIKPENILFRDDHTSVLADVGVAQLQSTHSHLIQISYKAGTPCYLAPEQVTRKRVDNRTDIYSLGVVLYEMLTGEQLFKGANTVSISYQHVHKKIPPLPPTCHYLQPVLNKALAKKRQDRYVDVDAFAAALHAAHEQHLAEYKTQYIPQNRFAAVNKPVANKPTIKQPTIKKNKTKTVAPTSNIKPTIKKNKTKTKTVAPISITANIKSTIKKKKKKNKTKTVAPTTSNTTKTLTTDGTKKNTDVKTLSFFTQLIKHQYKSKPTTTTLASLGLLFLTLGSGYYLMSPSPQPAITSASDTQNAIAALNKPTPNESQPEPLAAPLSTTHLVADQGKQETVKPIAEKEKEPEKVTTAVSTESTKQEAETKKIVAEAEQKETETTAKTIATEAEQKETTAKTIATETAQKETETKTTAAEAAQKETETKTTVAEAAQKESETKTTVVNVEQKETEAKRIAAETTRKEAEANKMAAEAAEKEKAKKTVAKKKKKRKPNIIDQYIAQEERRLAREKEQQRAAAQRRLQQQRADNNKTAQRVDKVRDDENIFINYE